MKTNLALDIQVTKEVARICSCEYIKNRLTNNRKEALTNLQLYRKQQAKLKLLITRDLENE